jgi:hypothetical protein
MKFKALVLGSMLLGILSGPTLAGCIGTGSLKTCYGSDGNTYTVNKVGSTTYMNGYNAYTGSTWSQRSTTLGSTTYHSGIANGRSWNMTQQRIGSGNSFFGTNSWGKSINSNCLSGLTGC